jgi:hypothetical protein
MHHSFQRISPAMVVALIALFVALSGTAVAAGVVPLAKRALSADNAKKLGGQSKAQIAAAAAALPGPANNASSLITVKTSPWSLNGGQGTDFTVACDAGQKVASGGYDNPNGDALALDTRPSPDGAGWKVFVLNLDASAAASGTLFAVCVK